jgi:polyferredoxin
VPVYGVPLYDFLPHFLIIILLSLIFGRFFCGWVCPLGAFSDGLNGARKALKLEKVTLPKKSLVIIKKARAVWLVLLFLLAIAIILPFIGLNAFQNELFLVSCQTCPARNLFPILSLNKPAWFQFDNPITIVLSIIGIIFLALLFAGFFGKRIWCRFCPNGIVQSWFNKGCLITKEKEIQKCTRCGKRVCPMDNEHVFEEKKKKNMSSRDCINCFTCVDKCPEDSCLKVKFLGKTIFKSRYQP